MPIKADWIETQRFSGIVVGRNNTERFTRPIPQGGGILANYLDCYKSVELAGPEQRVEGGKYIIEHIKKQPHASRNASADTDFLSEQSLQDDAMPDFLVGVLHLLKAMGQRQQNGLIEALYEANGKLRQSLWARLREFTEQSEEKRDLVEQCENDEAIKRYKNELINACNRLEKKQSDLSKRVRNIVNSMETGDQ